MIEVDISAQPENVVALWCAAVEVADQLPPGWVLVGGLMVQLHVLERDASEVVRVTSDIDVLGRARHPENLRALANALLNQGFKIGNPDLDGYSHRLERDGLLVDLLAEDGLNRRVEIVKGTPTVGIPGGTQALTRAEPVRIITPVGGVDLSRPSLLGAILLKARSLKVHRDPDAQLADLVRLLSLVDDPIALRQDLKTSERKWLRDVVDDVAGAPDRRRDEAETALQLLVGTTD